MGFNGTRAGGPARSYSRRQVLKSSAVTGALAAGLVGGLSSCTPPWDSKFSPKIPDWLQQISIAVGAGVITEILTRGLKRAWPAWEPEIGGSLEEILAGAAIAADSAVSGDGHLSGGLISTMAARRFIPGGIGWGHPVPPVIMVQVSQTPHGDPATDLLVTFVNTGSQRIVLKPWAWQTLLMFVHNLTDGQSGASLDIARAGCALSLLPSAVRPSSGHSPEGTVDWVTYHSRNGWVEISRQASDTSTGVITASAIQDSRGKLLSMRFSLPS